MPRRRTQDADGAGTSAAPKQAGGVLANRFSICDGLIVATAQHPCDEALGCYALLCADARKYNVTGTTWLACGR